jgi:AraC-like DNA-binding protein
MTLFVTFDELQPVLELAAYYRLDTPINYRYRVPGQHFLLIEEGRIDARTPQGEVSARSGDMLCFPAADENQYGYDGAVRYYEAHIQFALPPRHRHSVWIDGTGPLPLKVSLGGECSSMRRVFETYCIQLSQPGPAARALVTSALWEMLAILARVVRPSERSKLVLDVWQRVRMRLAGDLQELIEIQALAKEAELSVDHLIRGFRQRFGISPGQYRSRERFRQAAHRLRNGNEPIKAVAHAFGFADAYSFTRAFRRHLGVLPSDLRSGRIQSAMVDAQEDLLLPINRHVVPPNVGADFYGKYQPIH